ncbi:MAG TPA: hypothetical protein VIS06_21845 [Mycobacteriales bacterium]
MAGPVYAVETDLADSVYLPKGVTAPTGTEATRLLTRASRRVDRLLLPAVYDVDDTGAPTDPAVIEAVRDATCAQAAWWLETGDESGAAGQYQSVGIGSVNLTRRTSDDQDDTTSPDAVDVLTQAGLFTQGPVLWG